MGRELRRVPADWEHPKQKNGNWQPMHNEYYLDALNDWLKEHDQWNEGNHIDLIRNPERKLKYPFYAMWGGNPPDVELYQTRKFTDGELTHIQLYESTSEGTPISPIFGANQLDELCEYAAEHCSTFADSKATKEQWYKMLSGGLVYHQEGNNLYI